MTGIGRQWIAGLGLACLAALCSTKVRADTLRVHVAGGACPDAELLQQKLAPLLRDMELAFDTTLPATFGPGEAAVRDHGARYTVEVPGLARDFEDPARDCVERARVAAVLIALNVRPEQGGEEGKTGTGTGTESEAEAEADSDSGALTYGLRVFADAAYATEIEHAAFGAGAGVWLAPGALRFAFTAAVLSPADVPLVQDSASSGAVELMRFPLIASAGYALRLGAFELGPSIGIALDLLRLRGQGVPRAETELRLNPGGLLALDARLRIAPSLLGVLRLGVFAFPRAYDLSVDPLGALGQTPQIWLAANLGLDWRL